MRWTLFIFSLSALVVMSYYLVLKPRWQKADSAKVTLTELTDTAPIQQETRVGLVPVKKTSPVESGMQAPSERPRPQDNRYALLSSLVAGDNRAFESGFAQAMDTNQGLDLELIEVLVREYPEALRSSLVPFFNETNYRPEVTYRASVIALYEASPNSIRLIEEKLASNEPTVVDAALRAVAETDLAHLDTLERSVLTNRIVDVAQTRTDWSPDLITGLGHNLSELVEEEQNAFISFAIEQMATPGGHQGALQVAVALAQSSPAMAAKIRDELDTYDNLEEWLPQDLVAAMTAEREPAAGAVDVVDE